MTEQFQPPDPADRLILPPESVEAGYAEARAGLGTFNLGLFGLTGVGKSTLVNAVFGTELARTGIGDPVTQQSRLYRHHTATLGLYDTKGLEIGDDSEAVLTDLRRFVESNRLGAPSDQIHVIWYAIRAGTRRIQPGEQQFIRAVAALGIPVLLVMTQTPLTAGGAIHPDAAELAESIDGLQLPVRGSIHFVNALGDEFAGVVAFGLPALLDATAQVAPEGVRTALAAAQRVSRDQKRRQAQAQIRYSEQRVTARLLLKGLGQEWTRMFAAIAAIYDMPEHDSRAVLERVRTIVVLRRLLRVGNAGILVAMFGPTAAMAITRRLRGRPQDAPGLEAGAYTASDTSGGEDVTRIRTGFAAGQVTTAIGEAWMATCEHLWAATYPEAPNYADHDSIAQRFADDLKLRLPKTLQRLHDRK